MRVVKIVGKRASVCGYGKNCTLTLSWFPCSCVRYEKHIIVGAKRFRCAEVLFELPEGNIITVGAKRFRCAGCGHFTELRRAKALALWPSRQVRALRIWKNE